jgi:HPt (histidine-containing phosphotransfer) domain-containing protein
VSAAAEGDIEQVRQVAHKIRGSASSFGLRAVAEITAKIEEQAASGQLPGGDEMMAVRNAGDRAIASLRAIADEAVRGGPFQI